MARGAWVPDAGMPSSGLMEVNWATISAMNATHPHASAVASPVRWTNRFARLGEDFFTRLPPTPLPAPRLLAHSAQVADLLGMPADWVTRPEAVEVFSGNLPLQGTDPMATVYSGHQFGVWAGQLGDGRAILLGEVEAGWEVQLKGAGRTPYSRMGDGRAVLRSSVREFLASEAMHGLGIPTTRALCLTASPAPVRREEVETAAVVTRVAPSFIRFGHFEHFSYSGQFDALRRLADHVIDQFYPHCRAGEGFGGNAYAAFLEAVGHRTARLMAQWQAVGFCHGVMNTDNMSILGLSIDYGPFQFLDAYAPGHVCNHSDTQGRYAYNRQPNIAYWNLFALAQALMPLIAGKSEDFNDDDQALAMAALEPYKTQFPEALEQAMRAKLGLVDRQDGDRELVEDILKLLARGGVDYTIFWRRLSHHVAGTAGQAPAHDLFLDRPEFERWLARHAARVAHQDARATGLAMLATNPKYVLRNHLGEECIRAAKLGDASTLQALQAVLAAPFDEHPAHEAWAGFPPDWASSIEISCSS